MSDSKRTPEVREKFLATLTETCNVTMACKAAHIGRTTAYAWRDEDEDFKAAWEAAEKLGWHANEDEMNRRAFHGYEEPVFHLGQPCGDWYDADGKKVDPGTEGAVFRQHAVTKYSDTLAIFLSKAHDPQKYRERFEHTGPNGADLFAPLVASADALRAQLRGESTS